MKIDEGCGAAFFRPPLLLCLLFLLAYCLPNFAGAQQDSNDVRNDVKDAPSLRQPGETYRLRVQNEEYGRVEISADGGLTYFLVGRVRRPATGTVTEKGADTQGVVVRSGGDGLAFTVGQGRVVKLHPEPRASSTRLVSGVHLPAPTVPSEMTTNLAAGSGLFGDLTPPPGTTIRLQAAPGRLTPLTSDHALNNEDSFVFIVALPAQSGAAQQTAASADIEKRLDALAHAYAAGCVTRARAEGRTVVFGTLTLNARLPEGEPDPIVAVIYSIDDDLLAAQNVGPFSFSWDTRRAADGEHVVEITALNRNGRAITHARALIVVNNGK